MSDISETDVAIILKYLANQPEAHTVFIVLIWLCFTSRPLKIVELNDLVRFAVKHSGDILGSTVAQYPLGSSSIHSEDVLAAFGKYREDVVLIVSAKNGPNPMAEMFGEFGAWDSRSLAALVANKENTSSNSDDVYPVPATYSNNDTVEIKSPKFKDFLMSEEIKTGSASQFAIHEDFIHTYIARVCLKYLSQFDRNDSLNPRSSLDYPAALYCANVWYYHVGLASQHEKWNNIEEICMKTIQTPVILENIIRLSGSWPESIQPPDRHSSTTTPLMYASQMGLRMLCEALIEAGMDPNVEAGPGSLRTPLVMAANRGHTDVVELLLDVGVPVDGQQKFQNHTALQQASDRGHLEIIKLLLDRGADVEKVGFDNNTAVESAAHMTSIAGNVRPGGVERQQNFKNVVNFLLDRGARPRTSIVYIAEMDDLEFMTKVLDLTDDINIVNTINETALVNAIHAGRSEVVKLLLDRGAEIKGVKMGKSPMQVAITRGRQDIIQMLVDAGARLSDSLDTAPSLFQAQNLETLALLLRQGADINAKDERGSTFLHHAISYFSSEIVEFLLDNGANIHAKDAKGRTPIYRAAYSSESVKSPRNFELLLSAGADINVHDDQGITPLIDAGALGRLSHLQRVLSAGADLTVRDNSGVNVLMEAAGSGNADTVEYLLNCGSDISTVDSHNRSVLHHAVTNKRVQESRGLMARETQWSKSDGFGFMLQMAGAHVMHEATKALEVVNLLLKRGAAVNAADEQRMTPLHLAAQQGFTAIVEALLHNGADVSARNNGGRDALELARQAEYESVVNVLQASSAARYVGSADKG